VRGFGTMSFQRCRNVFDYPIDVFHHVVVPITKNQVTHCFENPCSLSVGLCLNRVLAAVDFHNQASIGTKEIDDEAINGKLSPKFPPAKTAIPQAKPKRALRISLVAT
jgi:hypothetical protein